MTDPVQTSTQTGDTSQTTQPSNAGAGTQQQSGQTGAGAGQDAGSPSKAARPDWLPEGYWDDAAGSIKGADLKTKFDELTAFKANEDSRRAAAPEKADGYKLAMPADFRLPDGVNFEFNEADPMVSIGRQLAHAVGLDQASFETLMVKPYIESRVAAMQAESAEIARLTEANDKALGAKAAERRDAVESWLAAKLGPEYLDVFKHILPVAKAVEGFERVMRLGSSGGMPGFTQTGRSQGSGVSDEDYAKMSASERLVYARKQSAAGGRR